MQQHKYSSEELQEMKHRAYRGAQNWEGTRPEVDDLTREELGSVISELQTATEPEYRSELMRILYWSSWHVAEDLPGMLEPFLAGPDPYLAGYAMEILCMNGYIANYREHVRGFLRGVPWDHGDFLRLMALQCLGDYLQKHRDRDLLEEIVLLHQKQPYIGADDIL